MWIYTCAIENAGNEKMNEIPIAPDINAGREPALMSFRCITNYIYLHIIATPQIMMW